MKQAQRVDISEAELSLTRHEARALDRAVRRRIDVLNMQISRIIDFPIGGERESGLLDGLYAEVYDLERSLEKLGGMQ
jgi:hypothetical protein